MQTQIRRAEFPANSRVLVISDLHGHAQGLKALLNQAAFTPEDVLVIAGDYVDKGPESLETVRYVMELCRTHTVYSLLGNTDYWRLVRLLSDEPQKQQDLVQYSLNAAGWWPGTFFGDLCAEIGEPLFAEMDTRRVFARLQQHFAPELDFLKKLPTILETPHRIFVHGGIPHERLEELDGTPCHPLMKWDHFMQDAPAFSRYVTVGHWPTALYCPQHPCGDPVIDRERRILSIDGGCGVREDGQLNLLVFANPAAEDFTLLRWTPQPSVTALEAQKPVSASSCIRWGDHEVEVAQRRGDTALIRHHGHELLAPASFLWQEGGRDFCSGISDRLLEVVPGDRLALVAQTCEGAYVLKDGQAGWYKGRWQNE